VSFADVGSIWAMTNAQKRADNFASTQAGLQSAFDFAGPGGKVFVGGVTITGITNLTMYGKCMLQGCGPQQTVLQRDAAATGTMLREKTAGEGNANGASGIIIQDISFRGNGSAGDGLNLGNQGGATFTSNAGLHRVLARDFPSGTGIILNANSIRNSDIWVVACLIGMQTGGGSCHYDGTWAEACSQTNLDVTSAWNTFVHTHLERAGTTPSKALMYVEASRNLFLHTDITLDANLTNNLIVEKSGVSNQQYIYIVVNGAFTWTNTIYNETFTNGSGNKDFMAFVFDNANGETSYLRDHSNNRWFPIGPGIQSWQRQAQGTTMSSASTISPDAYGFFYLVSGTTTINNISTSSADAGRVIMLQTTGSLTINHNGPGNIRNTGGTNLAMTANDIVQYVSDGTNWWQCAAVVAIP